MLVIRSVNRARVSHDGALTVEDAPRINYKRIAYRWAFLTALLVITRVITTRVGVTHTHTRRIRAKVNKLTQFRARFLSAVCAKTRLDERISSAAAAVHIALVAVEAQRVTSKHFDWLFLPQCVFSAIYIHSQAASFRSNWLIDFPPLVTAISLDEGESRRPPSIPNDPIPTGPHTDYTENHYWYVVLVVVVSLSLS